MSHTEALLKGYAEWLDAHDFGVWSETRAYQNAERGIFMAKLPETNNEAIALTFYAAEYERTNSLERVLASTRIQVRYRLGTDPLAGVRFYDRLFAAQDRQRLALGDWSARVDFLSYSPLGEDRNQRWTFTTNWAFSSIQAISQPPT